MYTTTNETCILQFIFSDEFLNNEKNCTEYAVHGYHDFSTLIFTKIDKEKIKCKSCLLTKTKYCAAAQKNLDYITKGKIKEFRSYRLIIHVH